MKPKSFIYIAIACAMPLAAVADIVVLMCGDNRNHADHPVLLGGEVRMACGVSQ